MDDIVSGGRVAEDLDPMEPWITENGVRVDPKLYEEWYYIPHRNMDTRWTPVTAEVVDLINYAYEECGSNWAELCRQTKVWPRHLRKIRRGKLQCVSFMVLDRLVSRSALSWRLHELPWYTIEELISLRIWKPQRSYADYVKRPKKGE